MSETELEALVRCRKLYNALEQENAALREALNNILAYGHPLEYPKADDALRRIQQIATEALSGNPGAKTGPENP
jgi:hypothetical protein